MITVKDIREKEFSIQKHGYHEDEVDEFLDEIADQMEALIRENRAMVQELEEAKAAQARAESALARAESALDEAEAVSPAPEIEPEKPSAPENAAPVDDSSYFKNLEATLRETLLSAQRIADQTVQEAKQKANATLTEAEQFSAALRDEAKRQADALMGNVSKETEQARAQLDSLKKSIDEHKSKFVDMLKEQLKLLGPGEDE